jgi:hypothetical protein
LQQFFYDIQQKIKSICANNCGIMSSPESLISFLLDPIRASDLVEHSYGVQTSVEFPEELLLGSA